MQVFSFKRLLIYYISIRYVLIHSLDHPWYSMEYDLYFRSDLDTFV